ncbi:hypothetical protein [Arthrobacter sp.]|uniref:hypothetical protein n=1 Tax=Arthrobacter sp. TaxID=1667 RepID=UPI003A8D6506
MTLSTYVLAARLRPLPRRHRTAAGHDRERYALVHDDTPKGNAKSGLGLHVLDAWTGQRRDTRPCRAANRSWHRWLSALGLADVIQQQSGGIDIETLFVDEGFGSLDGARWKW